jgi:hypothetical protein
LKSKYARTLSYIIVAALLLGSVAIIPQPRTAYSANGSRRAGVYLAIQQSYGSSGELPTAQDFVNAYFYPSSSPNAFSTIMFYVPVYTPADTQRVLQIASLVDSNPNIRMAIEMGFNLNLSSDWSTLQSFMSQLATHASVGWVGIEGEHTTYDLSGCEFSGSCKSVGQAWNAGTLSESQLESYFSQFNNMAANAGLNVVDYYVTFGSSSFQNSQPAVLVTQWPVCSGSPYDSPCNPITNQIGELDMGTSSPYIGISGGLSTNMFDAWNPSVNQGTYHLSWDNVISTYVAHAEQHPSSVRSLVLFETGGYQFVDDWKRPVFMTDLYNAMQQYSDWIYPNGSPLPTTTTSSASTGSTSRTTASTSSSTSPTTSTTSSTSAATSTQSSASVYSINFNAYANGAEPANWYYDPSFSVWNGLYQSTGSTGYQVAYYRGQSFGDGTYTVQATGLSSQSIGGQSPPVLAIAFKMQDRVDGYWFWGDIDKIQIVKWVNGYSYVLAGQSIGQINPTGGFLLSVSVTGSNIVANWNGQYTIGVQDSTFSSGYAGVGTYHMGAGFNNLVVSGAQSSTTTSTAVSSSISSSTSTTSSTSASSGQTTLGSTTTSVSLPGTQNYLISVEGSCPSTGAGWYLAGSTATIGFDGVCNRSGGQGLRVASWSLDGGRNLSVSTNSTGRVTIPADAPHTLKLYTVVQYEVSLDYGAQASLLSITKPAVFGDNYWYDSSTKVVFVGRAEITGFSVVGWGLDGGPQIPVNGAPDFTASFWATGPHVLHAVLKPTSASCGQASCSGSQNFVTSIQTNTDLPSGVWVDGAYFPSSASLSWQEGSVHNITAAQGGSQSSFRTYFSQWSGESRSKLPTVMLTVNASGSLTAEYTEQYLVSFSFTDASGNPLTPQAVTLSGPSGKQGLGANLTAWADSGASYTLSSVMWLNWNVVMANDSRLSVYHPGAVTFPLRVFTQTIRAADAYGLPLRGALVNVTTLNGIEIVMTTDSQGTAHFRVPEGLFSATVSFLGVNNQIVSVSEGSHSYTFTFMLSYPLLVTIGTVVAITGVFAMFRLRKKPKFGIAYFSDES